MGENLEQIRAVQRMQDYIIENSTNDLSLEALAQAAAYSPWHALRTFTELTGKTPFDYIRAVRLSKAAKRVRDTDDTILDIALDAGFTSHEGFSRAFARMFDLSPRQYREAAPPIQLFTPYRIYTHFDNFSKGDKYMSQQCNIIYTSIEQRPARKFILKRGNKAEEYFAYCEEVGCDIWGMLESIKGALYEPIGAWLPEILRTPGTSKYVMGVEMPMDYAGPVPDGFEIIALPAGSYMQFHGEPYEDQFFGDAVSVMSRAIERYNPATHGYHWADDAGPRFQYAPIGSRGYIEYRPVKAIAPANE